jgi:hypothetical protein
MTRNSRLVMVLMLSALLANPLPSYAQGDANWSDLGFTDITGSTLQVNLDFTNQQGVAQNVNAANIPGGLVPPAVQQLLQDPVLSTPLNQFFDQQWSQTENKNGQTMRDLSCAMIRSTIVKQVKQALNKGAYNISCNLASSGALGARVADGTMTNQEPAGWHYAAPFYLVPGGQYVMLAYWLPANSVTFSVPVNAGPLNVFGDPSYTINFDGELMILADMANNYPATCTDAVYGWMEAHNANIKAANAVADVEDALASFWQGIRDQPTALFQGAEGDINSSVEGVGPLGPLTNTFGQWATACNGGAAFGFTQFQAGIQNSGLAFTFSHPDLPKPSLTNLIAQHNGGSFLNNIVGTQHVQVRAGQSDAVNGFFDVPSVTSLQIGWSPSMPVGHANVRWGLHGKAQTTVSQSGAEFDPTNLSPNATYDFQVQVCDLVGCSPWSDTLSATTSATGTDKVVFKLASGSECTARAKCTDVGSTTVGADGTLSGTITIPAATRPGQYTLQAQSGVGAGAQTATTPLTVLGAGEQAQPKLEMWDTVANRAYTGGRTVQGLQFTLHGESFPPGDVTVTLDTPGGPSLGSALAAGDGTFQGTFSMPYTSIGTHTLVASGATLQVTVDGAAQ